MKSITVQYDSYLGPRSNSEMANLYSDIQAGVSITVRLGPHDAHLVYAWFVNGSIDKLKLEMWPGPT